MMVIPVTADVSPDGVVTAYLWTCTEELNVSLRGAGPAVEILPAPVKDPSAKISS